MIANLTLLHRGVTDYLIEDNIASMDQFYCPPHRAFDWQNGTEILEGSSSFEQRLKDFFKRDLGAPHADSLLVLVGGTGTGKTTTVNKIIGELYKEQIKCTLYSSEDHLCVQKPILIKLDFIEIPETTQEDSPETAELQFWAYVAANLQTSARSDVPISEEVTSFWSWCLTQPVLLANSPLIHKFLDTQAPYLVAYKTGEELMGLAKPDILKFLSSARSSLIETFTSKDHSWYKVFLFKYNILEQKVRPCQCAFIFFDNVDHLHPIVQNVAVAFASNLTSLLRARTIVTIRPLTWERTIHVQKLTSIEYQYSPSLFEMLKRRINWFLSTNTISNEERTALLSLTEVMTGKSKDPLLSRLLTATAGHSVRFAARNFSNMLESPLLEAISVTDVHPFDSQKVSTLARAFFFGKRNALISHAFENLYKISNVLNFTHALIKPRILDYILRIRSGHAHLSHLFQFLEMFSYNKGIYLEALNELLDPRRPLLWCNIGFHLDHHTQDGKVISTPIGSSYYKLLFGEVFYDEVCLATDILEQVDIRRVYELHQNLTDQDMKEITALCVTHGSISYNHLYGLGSCSLSYIHGKNLMKGLPKRASLEKQRGVYDPARLKWIQSRVEEMLNEPE